VTIDEAHVAFERVAAMANIGDDEAAHSLEDDLHRAVLRHIADRPTSRANGQLARLALRTQHLNFARWCA
jgi:hypothetical protein